uniref:Putative secreted protein n=1 Tax=Anopheles marajoara TaxID=58244 RepID=A0A2M4CDY4_9DIPT
MMRAPVMSAFWLCLGPRGCVFMCGSLELVKPLLPPPEKRNFPVCVGHSICSCALLRSAGIEVGTLQVGRHS